MSDLIVFEHLPSPDRKLHLHKKFRRSPGYILIALYARLVYVLHAGNVFVVEPVFLLKI